MLEEFTDEEAQVLARLEEELTEIDPQRDVTTSCFPGDTGKLRQDVRKVLVKLLEGPFLSRADNPSTWDVFLKNRDVIVSRINELFLEVEVNEELEVAYRTNAQSEGTQPFPSLMRRAKWNLWEVRVLVVLRRQYEAEALMAMEGEPITMLEEEIAEAALEVLPASISNISDAQTAIGKAIEALRTHRLLHKVGDGEYRVDPMIAIVLSTEQSKELEPWLQEYGQNGSNDMEEQA
ncbi:DUF4194 domain-containing protein [Agrococcus sp. Ld7]|uniref:DUF4194 domain-containing protein n=1 Tax=Agrococcus sp. Ld7 TaxID=649148 RepID=UPI00386343B2